VIVLVDNYDSFTFNLYQFLAAEAGGRDAITVVRNDERSAEEVLALRPTHVVLSPGPGHPSRSGLSLVLPPLLPETPLLGVCLGHQALALCFGARVERSPRPRHGLTVPIRHDGAGLFEGLPQGFPAALYHSLAVTQDTVPPTLAVSAWTAEGDIMALRHNGQPSFGVQFHPESFMTTAGTRLLRNFLALR